MITDRRKFTTKLTLYGMYSFHFRVRINSVFFLGYTLRTGNVPTQIFNNVRYPILRIKTNSTLYSWYAAVLVLPGDRYMELKISNAAYNADITQSQERDTRHRRMQEVNSL